MIIKCSPCIYIRKAIHDNDDRLYLESQNYKVHSNYQVLMCHSCQKYGHKEYRCAFKTESKDLMCIKFAGIHMMQSCTSTDKKYSNGMKKGNTTNIDHAIF